MFLLVLMAEQPDVTRLTPTIPPRISNKPVLVRLLLQKGIAMPISSPAKAEERNSVIHHTIVVARIKNAFLVRVPTTRGNRNGNGARFDKRST
jgi:hypothetical protein